MCGCSQVSGVDTYRAKTFLTELRCSQSYSGVGVHRVTELQWCGCSQSYSGVGVHRAKVTFTQPKALTCPNVLK